MALVKQTPRYREIAVNIAHDIIDKKLNVGDKLQARSTVAIKYNVSPETARRAINVLVEVGIVETRQGSGTVIKSCDNAVDFISTEDDKHSLSDLKSELLNQITEQEANLHTMQDSLKKFFNQSQDFQRKNPLSPFELTLTQPSDAYGKSLSDLNFWYMTGTTLVGILRHEELLISPGPYATIQPGDTLYFIGDIDAVAKVEAFLFNITD